MILKCLGLVGFTLILTNGYITENFRFWLVNKNKVLGRFFSCSMCVGFWVGFIYFYCYLLSKTVETIFGCILFGSAISFMSCLSDSLINFLKVNDGMLWWRNSDENSKNTGTTSSGT